MSNQHRPDDTPTDPTNTDHANTDHKLPVVICPGFHDKALTAQMVRSLPSFTRHYIADTSPVDPFAVHQWLAKTLGNPTSANPVPVVGIGFSAGVIGLAGALALWRQQGGNVARLIAVDGWGVPVVGVPVCRISHDKFTHWSTVPLDVIGEMFGEAGQENFYAEPPVEHLALWGDLEAAQGWQVDRGQLDEKLGIPMSAADFLRRTLRAEWNQVFNWR